MDLEGFFFPPWALSCYWEVLDLQCIKQSMRNALSTVLGKAETNSVKYRPLRCYLILPDLLASLELTVRKDEVEFLPFS